MLDERLQHLRKEFFGSNYLLETERLSLIFADSVVLDLAFQNWKLQVDDSVVRICRPSPQGHSSHSPKDSVRKGHLLSRDAQLREQSVVEFVKGMEVRRRMCLLPLEDDLF
jgi:hypothetical protein